ncbi:hypothetical protein MBT84_37710 [Streptomyces sp. MBT84]|uniref:hypothetical protein n=1 Tax=unclassified Streptomyces TaxID=2593676 RepID=UPI001C6F3C93|nr:hypothetical protein [Streptomyces sp. MBT84]
MTARRWLRDWIEARAWPRLHAALLAEQRRAGIDEGVVVVVAGPVDTAEDLHGGYGMEPGDEELSQLLDEPGKPQPLLTLGEARALHYVAHLLGLGGAAAADAARELELRLERRLKVMFPDQDILLRSVRYD